MKEMHLVEEHALVFNWLLSASSGNRKKPVVVRVFSPGCYEVVGRYAIHRVKIKENGIYFSVGAYDIIKAEKPGNFLWEKKEYYPMDRLTTEPLKQLPLAGESPGICNFSVAPALLTAAIAMPGVTCAKANVGDGLIYMSGECGFAVYFAVVAPMESYNKDRNGLTGRPCLCDNFKFPLQEA